MSQRGMTLNKLFEKRDKNLSASSIYSIGIQLLNTLEKVHASGFVYNNISPSNILLDLGIDATDFITSSSINEDIFA